MRVLGQESHGQVSVREKTIWTAVYFIKHESEGIWREELRGSFGGPGERWPRSG